MVERRWVGDDEYGKPTCCHSITLKILQLTALLNVLCYSRPSASLDGLLENGPR
jgi:hypothetical protein